MRVEHARIEPSFKSVGRGAQPEPSIFDEGGRELKI